MFEVRDRTGKVLPGIPTPRLIEAGGGKAYFEPPSGEWFKGVWFLFSPETGHVGNGEYTDVRIVHTEEWTVYFDIKPLHPQDDADEYRDQFVVHASSETEAMRRAEPVAQEDVESRYGEDWGSDIKTIRAVKGAFYH